MSTSLVRKALRRDIEIDPTCSSKSMLGLKADSLPRFIALFARKSGRLTEFITYDDIHSFSCIKESHLFVFSCRSLPRNLFYRFLACSSCAKKCIFSFEARRIRCYFHVIPSLRFRFDGKLETTGTPTSY